VCFGFCVATRSTLAVAIAASNSVSSLSAERDGVGAVFRVGSRLSAQFATGWRARSIVGRTSLSVLCFCCVFDVVLCRLTRVFVDFAPFRIAAGVSFAAAARRPPAKQLRRAGHTERWQRGEMSNFGILSLCCLSTTSNSLISTHIF
jgi:hypothetical protein